MTFIFPFPGGQHCTWGQRLGFTVCWHSLHHLSTTVQASTMVTFAMPKSMVPSACGGDTIIPYKLRFVEEWEVRATGTLMGSCPGGNCQCWESAMCCQESWLQPVSLCWRPPGVLSLGMLPSVQHRAEERPKLHSTPPYPYPLWLSPLIPWAWEPFLKAWLFPCSFKPHSLYQIPRNLFVDTTRII